MWRCSCVSLNLSPEIVCAILVGQRPVELTPTRLVMLSRNLPHDWQERGGSSDLRLPDVAPIQPNARHVMGRKRALEISRAFARLRPRFCVSGTGPLRWRVRIRRTCRTNFDPNEN